METEPLLLALAVLGVLSGGILKGATGVGAPVIAVPVLAAVFDVATAVTIFVLPNLFLNIWQAWSFRHDALPRRITVSFAGAGLVGAAAGTVMLAALSARGLQGAVAVVVLAYVAFRLTRPAWRLEPGPGGRLAAPVGLIGGILQGAVGISAPVSVTYLNAMRLERAAFIGTISIFFIAMSLSQLPAQIALGLMTGPRFLMGLAAIAIVSIGMPVGAWLSRRMSAAAFDRVLLGVLCLVGLRLGLFALGLAG